MLKILQRKKDCHEGGGSPFWRKKFMKKCLFVWTIISIRGKCDHCVMKCGRFYEEIIKYFFTLFSQSLQKSTIFFMYTRCIKYWKGWQCEERSVQYVPESGKEVPDGPGAVWGIYEEGGWIYWTWRVWVTYDF